VSKHNTGIQWTHLPGYTGETWNPVRGCRRVSPGCENCYAELLAANRMSGEGQAYEGIAERTPGGPRWTGRTRIVEHLLDQPLRWNLPQFKGSRCDMRATGSSSQETTTAIGASESATRFRRRRQSRSPRRALPLLRQRRQAISF